MSRMWWYTLGVLVLWIVNPELRRLAEWAAGPASVDLFPLIPFIAVLPHVWSLTGGGGWKRIPRPLAIAAWLWIGGFGYSFVVAIVNGNALAGSYALANFLLPVALGLWFAADRTPFAQSYARVTHLLFAVTTVVCAYGIVQYVIAPAWDSQWLRNVIAAGSLSFGRPAPFQIRVFSMLASPGPFASFVAVMLLLALPQLSLRRPWLLAQIPVWLVAFGLSLDRTGWIVFAAGAFVYGLLTPRRGTLLAASGLSAALLAGLVVVLPAAVGNENLLASLSDRFASFTELDHDRSGNERLNLYDTGLQLMWDAPFGHGLGVVGTATKLSDTAATTDFDSGVLARLVEMGLPGTLLFTLGIAVLTGAIVAAWQNAGRFGDGLAQSICAMAGGVIVGLIGSEIFGDVNGLAVLMLWLIAAFAVRSAPALPAFRFAPALA